jgi:hypothetical protein
LDWLELNRSEVSIGLVLIVLGVIFFYPVLLIGLVDLFIVMLIVGFVLLVEGLGGLAVLRSGLGRSKQVRLSELDRVVLQMLSEKKTQEEIAQSTGVSPAILSDKLAGLATAGYVSGNYLTEKGFEALRSSGEKA